MMTAAPRIKNRPIQGGRVSAFGELTASGHDDSATVGPPGRLERAFFFFCMVVLQGAFLTTLRMIASGGAVPDEFIEGDPINQASFGLLLLGTALLMTLHFRASMQAIRSNALYFLLPALIICSTVWSVAPGLTMKRSIWNAGVCFFDLYIVMRLTMDEILSVVSRTIILSLLASIVVAVAMPNVGREMGTGLNGEWRGVFAQKNQLGHVMAFGATAQLLIMLRAGRLKVGAILLFIACLGLIKLSESATSLLAVIAVTGVAIVFACVRRGWGSVLMGSLLSGAGLCLLVAIVFREGGSGLAFLDRDSSFSGRTELWPPVIEMIRMHLLLGWGFEAFWTPDNPAYEYVRTLAGWPAPNAHNGLLEVALDLGLVGVAALLFVLTWAAKRAIGLMCAGDLLGISIIILLIELVIGNITESFVLKSSIFGWNFLTILILATGLKNRGAMGFAGLPLQTIVNRAKPRTASNAEYPRSID
jgi:exopolysaccharide production protein ExoQ